MVRGTDNTRKMVYTSMEGNFKIPVVGPFIRFLTVFQLALQLVVSFFMNEMTDAVKEAG